MSQGSLDELPISVVPMMRVLAKRVLLSTPPPQWRCKQRLTGGTSPRCAQGGQHECKLDSLSYGREIRDMSTP